MKRNQVINIVSWSTIALIVPVLGQLFVDGWNWGLGDFIFAWVFFNLLGFTTIFVSNKINHKIGKIVGTVIVVAIFAFVWIRLATG